MTAPSDPGPTILVVEDDLLLAELITLQLQAANYQTCHASDGIGGLERMAEGGIDAVILDLGLPKLDGRGVLRALRQTDGAMGGPPVMILSARHQIAETDEAIRLGARDYLTKPFEVSLLLARVARLLRIGHRPNV